MPVPTHKAVVKFVNQTVPFYNLTYNDYTQFNNLRLQRYTQLAAQHKTDGTIPTPFDEEIGAGYTVWASEQDANDWITFISNLAANYNLEIEIKKVEPFIMPVRPGG